MDATQPFRRGQGPGHDGAAGAPVVRAQTPAAPRNDRVEHREQLYSVIRESMVRAGMLSSSYKFKVLSLDPRGRQFLVMMDLARELGKDVGRQSEIEAMVAQTAKARFDILVTAVYWRMNDHVAVGQPQMHNVAAPQAATQPSKAAAVMAAPVATAVPPAVAVAVAGPIAVPPARFEPIQADEVEAFRRALAGAVTSARADAASRTESAQRHDEGLFKPRPSKLAWPKRKPAARMTGYEDTEAFDPRERNPGLSTTQYGELN